MSEEAMWRAAGLEEGGSVVFVLRRTCAHVPLVRTCARTREAEAGARRVIWSQVGAASLLFYAPQGLQKNF